LAGFERARRARSRGLRRGAWTDTLSTAAMAGRRETKYQQISRFHVRSIDLLII
jgi:hypothetical protein